MDSIITAVIALCGGLTWLAYMHEHEYWRVFGVVAAMIGIALLIEPVVAVIGQIRYPAIGLLIYGAFIGWLRPLVRTQL